MNEFAIHLISILCACEKEKEIEFMSVRDCSFMNMANGIGAIVIIFMTFNKLCEKQIFHILYSYII